MKRLETILMGHGAGGRMTAELVRDLLLPPLSNPFLAVLDDAAVLPELPPGRPALTTDAFVVSPHVFPGGDLGHLAVTGTVNDLSMAGAKPLWLTWALIIEEGASTELLRQCVAGAAKAAEQSGVALVAGDTKVVPRGSGDAVYAVTAGLGIVPLERRVADTEIREGDVVIVTGPMGDHGATIMAARHDLGAEGLVSDCAPLSNLMESLWEQGLGPHALHDPTRGGLATVAAEVAGRCGLQIELIEDQIPVRPQVQAICDVLGLDPLYLACEGRAVLWVRQEEAEETLAALHKHPLGSGAARIGRVKKRPRGGSPVVLVSRSGGLRPLDLLSGAGLPRIC